MVWIDDRHQMTSNYISPHSRAFTLGYVPADN